MRWDKPDFPCSSLFCVVEKCVKVCILSATHLLVWESIRVHPPFKEGHVGVHWLRLQPAQHRDPTPYSGRWMVSSAVSRTINLNDRSETWPTDRKHFHTCRWVSLNLFQSSLTLSSFNDELVSASEVARQTWDVYSRLMKCILQNMWLFFQFKQNMLMETLKVVFMALMTHDCHECRAKQFVN